MSYGTVQAEKMTTESGYSLGAGNASSFKNRIINGEMDIDQRGVTVTNPNPSYVTDRWNAVCYGAATVAQSSTAPTGFSKSLLWTTTTASAPSAGQWSILNQGIEGYNTADLGWGTASAKTVTLSFWVYANNTGTYAISINNGTSPSTITSSTRSFVSTYTINAANTWEQKTVTITGDLTGTWGATNGMGICVSFPLGNGTNYQTSTLNAWQTGAFFNTSGCINLQNTASATFRVTGVQLEVGTVATSWDFRSYSTEFQLCQRYFYKNICATGGTNSTPLTPMGWSYSNNDVYLPVIFPQPMRTTPTLLRTGCKSYNPALGGPNLTGMTLYDASNISANLQAISSGGLTNMIGYWVAPVTVATDFVAFSAEL